MAPSELGHELKPIEEVRDIILSLVETLPAESCPLAQAHERVLREDIVAGELVPPFDNSAMDGYAVHSSDLDGASEEHPVTLRVEGEIRAGVIADAVLARGSAVRIMTGAPIPAGCDAVVPHELTRIGESEVTFTAPAATGKNVRPAGGDMRPGDRPLETGSVLRSTQLAIAASLGRADLRVTRTPRVAILSPGD